MHGGQPFGRGALYHLLQNRIYLGVIVHKGETHPGQHAAIIPPDLWDQVQEALATNREGRRQSRFVSSAHTLVGRLKDDQGASMVPATTHKANGQRYRYYVSEGLVRSGQAAGTSIRRWVNLFGPLIAADLHKHRPKHHTTSRTHLPLDKDSPSHRSIQWLG